MIRFALPTDLGALLHLEAVLFDNALSEEALKRELEAGQAYVYCDREGHIQGYALVRSDGELHDLTRLGVAPNAQNKGVGTELLRHVLQTGHATMLTVRKNNTLALRLYQRHGFRITGHFPAEDAWVLLREADAADGPSGR